VHAHGRGAAWRAWICPGFSKCGAWVTTARHGRRRRSRPPRPGGHGREAAWLVRRRREHGCTHTRPGEHGQPRRCGCWASGAAFVSWSGESVEGREESVGRVWGVSILFHFWQGTVDLHRTTESVPRFVVATFFRARNRSSSVTLGQRASLVSERIAREG
jgi:hypothetical protein